MNLTPITPWYRVALTFEEEGIQDELDAYNPMVPGGSDFKVTMMIEYPNI